MNPKILSPKHYIESDLEEVKGLIQQLNSTDKKVVRDAQQKLLVIFTPFIKKRAIFHCYGNYSIKDDLFIVSCEAFIKSLSEIVLHNNTTIAQILAFSKYRIKWACTAERIKIISIVSIPRDIKTIHNDYLNLKQKGKSYTEMFFFLKAKYIKFPTSYIKMAMHPNLSMENDYENLDLLLTNTKNDNNGDIEKIKELLVKLPEITQTILNLRYGLNGSPEYSVNELSSKFNISKKEINKIIKDAFSFLKGENSFQETTPLCDWDTIKTQIHQVIINRNPCDYKVNGITHKGIAIFLSKKSRTLGILRNPTSSEYCILVQELLEYLSGLNYRVQEYNFTDKRRGIICIFSDS